MALDLIERVPPSNLEAELALLGAVLLDAGTLDEVEALVPPEAWHNSLHRDVYEAARRLVRDTGAADLVELKARLVAGGLDGGAAALVMTEACEACVHTGNAARYAQLVRDKWVRRSVIQTCQRMASAGYDTDGHESGEEYAQRAAVAVSEAADTGMPTLAFSVEDCVRQAEAEISETGGVLGWGAGPQAFRALVPKFRAGHLALIAAQTSHGKSTFARNLAYDLQAHGTVLVFSLEDSRQEWAMALAAQLAGVQVEAVLDGTLPPAARAEFDSVRQALSELRIVVDDSPRLNGQDIAARTRAAARRHADLVAVIVDYVQEMAPPPGTHRKRTDEQVGDNVRLIRAAAKDLRIAAIALSQINRANQSGSTGQKRPTLRSMKNSGDLEQAAQLVVGLFAWWKEEPMTEWARGIAEAIVLKQSRGKTGTAVVGFEPWGAGFCDAFPEAEAEYRREAFKVRRDSAGRPGGRGW